MLYPPLIFAGERIDFELYLIFDSFCVCMFGIHLFVSYKMQTTYSEIFSLHFAGE